MRRDGWSIRLMPELGRWSVAFAADVVRPRLERDDLVAPEEREDEREAMVRIRCVVALERG